MKVWHLGLFHFVLQWQFGLGIGFALDHFWLSLGPLDIWY